MFTKMAQPTSVFIFLLALLTFEGLLNITEGKPFVTLMIRTKTIIKSRWIFYLITQLKMFVHKNTTKCLFASILCFCCTPWWNYLYVRMKAIHLCKIIHSIQMRKESTKAFFIKSTCFIVVISHNFITHNSNDVQPKKPYFIIKDIIYTFYNCILLYYITWVIVISANN